MENKLFIVIVIAEKRYCRGIRNLEVNEDGKSEVYLADKTTAKEKEKGKSVYGLSGKYALILDDEEYKQRKEGIDNYLKQRFGKNYDIRLQDIEVD